MKEFKLTYLCIKQHSITGLRYLCKTTKSYEKMLEYKGSGRPYWNNHLRVHGKEFVDTPWYCLFYDKEAIEEFALMCSEQWDIVKSDEWANLKPENGLEGGGAKGQKHIVINKRGPPSEETKALQRKANTGRLKTEECKKKMRETVRSGMTPSKLVSCPICIKEFRARGLKSHLSSHENKESA